MAKTKISEFSSTPANNTDIDSINIAEGCAPSGINDAIRELMSQLKDWQSGASNDPYVVGSSGSLTLNQGTANGVLYLNGSKVATSGSALWFDGTNFGVGTGGNTLNHQSVVYKVGANAVYQQIANGSTGLGATNGIRVGLSSAGVGEWYSPTAAISYIDNSEAMRLTSTGLGIGTSSPSAKLDVSGNAVLSGVSGYKYLYFNGSTESSSLRFAKIGKNYDSTFELGIWASTHTAGNSASTVFYRDLTTESMRLDSSGNLGLGVTPSAWSTSVMKAFQIGDGASFAGDTSGGYRARIFANAYYGGGDYKYMNNGPALMHVANANSSVYEWLLAGTGTAGNTISWTQAMTLDSSGNLLVGTTSANGLGGTTLNSGYALWNSSSNNTTRLFFWYNGSAVGTVTTTGTSTAYNTSSDQRLKENIQDADSASSLIDALQVRQFDWKSDGSHQRYGFVAQELVTVAPEAVHQPEDTEEMMAVDYSKLVPMLVKEIQSLRVRVAQLESN